MKRVFVFSLFLLAQSVCGATEFRIVYKEGRGLAKIQFPVATVNGTLAWTVSEKNNLISEYSQFISTSPVSVVLISPTEYELNLSTCAIGFESPEEFTKAQTQKGIIPILEALYLRLKVYQDASMNAKADDIQQRYNYLSSIAKSLP